LVGRDWGFAGNTHGGCLALPFGLKILLAAVHSPILPGDVPKQNDAYDYQRQGNYTSIHERARPAGESPGMLHDLGISVADCHRFY
jgi:hypothetical protein